MMKPRNGARAAICGAVLWLGGMGAGSAQPVPSPAPASAAPAPTSGVTNTPEAENAFSRYISAYEPIYFILGTHPAAEFQVSLKYQVSALTNGWARTSTNIYLAYTQTSFWDLLSSDPSFYDTSYKPSGFYYLPNVLNSSGQDITWLDVQFGLEHESNGRGGSAERSLYTSYVQPTLTLGHPEGLQWSLRPRAWLYVIGMGLNNPDMAKYRGYADVQSALTWRQKGMDASQSYKFTTFFDLGDDGGHAAWKFDLSFSVSQWVKWFTPRIHAQYFTGYGQTLRQYNQSSHGLRAGISLYD